MRDDDPRRTIERGRSLQSRRLCSPRSPSSVVRGLEAGSDAGGIGRRHLEDNWYQMRLLKIVLDTFAAEDYPGFLRKLPTNTVIRTSPGIVAALPADGKRNLH